VITSTLTLLFISAAAIVTRRRRPYLLVGWLWFLGTLFPVIGLSQAGNQSMADRYSYIPSIGILLATVWCVGELAGLLEISPSVLAIAIGGLALTSGAMTRLQICYWNNGESLWRHAADVTENNYEAYGMIGFYELSRTNYNAAITNLERSLRIKGGRAEVQLGLGIALRKENRLDEAISNLQAAVLMERTNVQARKEIALALVAMGRRSDAVTNLLYVLKVQPHDSQALEQMRKLSNAIAQ
jgi:tetratricopeptide (TPR) repeat protein